MNLPFVTNRTADGTTALPLLLLLLQLLLLALLLWGRGRHWWEVRRTLLGVAVGGWVGGQQLGSCGAAGAVGEEGAGGGGAVGGSAGGPDGAGVCTAVARAGASQRTSAW